MSFLAQTGHYVITSLFTQQWLIAGIWTTWPKIASDLILHWMKTDILKYIGLCIKYRQINVMLKEIKYSAGGKVILYVCVTSF